MNSLIFYGIIIAVFPIYGIQSKLYTTTNNVTYYINEMQQFTWHDAYIECSYREMALLTVDSKAQYDDILALLKGLTETPPKLWVGGIGDGFNFHWFYTGKSIKPTMWCHSCPNAEVGIRCIIFWDTYGLNNDGCSNQRGFVCEKRAQPGDCCENGTNVTINLKQNNKCT